MKEKRIRKVFLDELPKWCKGEIGKQGTINWKKSIGYKVKFIYDDIKGLIKIINYNKETGILVLEYNNKEFKMSTSTFRTCKLGILVNRYTGKFKIEINSNYKDEKRDITITDRKKIKDKNGKWWKYYKYLCSKCGFDCSEHYKNGEYKEELWITENDLLNGVGCSCCNGGNQIVVENINSIYHTDPWMIPFIGEEVAKTHTHSSNDKVQSTCPDCGRIKKSKVIISNIYTNHSIGCSCSDKVSYGEKFVFGILEQLKLNFQTQLSKTTLEWCKSYRYDFYFEYNNEQYIIETHGLQHYQDAWDKLEKTQENDILKKELALKNGIKEENYIVIDCRKSELEWIKQHILESNLAIVFDLKNIDWLQIEEFTCVNLAKKACEYKNNNPKLTTFDIMKIMHIGRNPIIKYLKIGNKLGWCNYNPNKEQQKTQFKKGVIPLNAKLTEILKDGVSLGIFYSSSDIEKRSEELFGIKLNRRNISAVCLGKQKLHRGFEFRFTN